MTAKTHRILTIVIALATFIATVATAAVAAGGESGTTVAVLVAAAFGAAMTALPTLLRQLADKPLVGGNPAPQGFPPQPPPNTP